jgi:hypothetical protein
MRDIHEVIRQKEAELTRINEELAALRLTLQLLSGESTDKAAGSESPKAAPVRVKNFP